MAATLIQFHELAKPQAHHPGEYRPEEDTAWEAYTLGRAPPTLEPGADLTVAQEAALAANVELARNAGSRYLVQRWGDGTYCEKIGRKREIEIQFHCSMTMTDTILFVKETQTCHYILHIATPRLCGEPVSSETYASADRSLPAADGPFRMPKRAPKPVIAPPPEEDKDKQEKALLTQAQHETLRKAIETLMANGELKAGEVIIQPFGEGDEEFVVEFIDYLNGEEDEEGTVHTQAPSLDEILRAAGLLDSKGPKKQPDSRDQDREDDEDKRIAKEPHTRDEL
ncbi:hypothetical protein EW026_g1412 [Hermanssonia centrifuga]|uniref:Protein OS-9 homolog n=1 Tax=Hermanssonia centrifuga TaxID=98765 RepID=A0A4S4KSA6_9APHY|nr:hypothetical protein EW026_g1412 [Hermanssonia centrifuga]